MKKEFSRILAVGLTVALLASLILVVAPVSAGTLSWSDKTIPSTDDYVLRSGNITDIAVAEEGDTIYAAVSDNVIYRSTDLGVTWSEITVIDTIDDVDVTLEPDFVAVAPDDGNWVATANASEPCGVYVSDDAGATWDTLEAPSGLQTINDIAVSVESGGNRWIAIVGENTTHGVVWYYEIGAVGAAWTLLSDNETDVGSGFITGNWSAAVEFSPNFASDETMVVVTANSSGEVLFQIFTFNQDEWNEDAGTFEDYPVSIVEHTADAQITDLKSASISLAPDYLGSDDAMRLAFVSLTCATDDEASGIFRLDDEDVEVLKDEKMIHSIAYDGVNLVAGRYDGTDVYRSDDPLASSPSVKGSASLKSPGGEELVVVAWAGDVVVAGTSGDESAFAVSRDDGKAFNDISLIDTSLNMMLDVAVSPDGSSVYLATVNWTDLSLWRYASTWERVLSVIDAGSDFIVRTAPDDMDVVYVAEIGGNAIYYSADAGEARWQTRTSRYEITNDLAVETDGGVVYVLTASGYISKSTNSGFSWASKKSSKLTAGGSMLTSLGEDVLLAGSQDGYVSYSTDGGTTWTKLDERIANGNVQVIATGVTTDDFVYAATDVTAETDIYRWDWADEEWDAITDEDVSTNDNVTGIALQGGVLYAVSVNATGGSTSYRSLDPTAESPTWSTMASVGELFDAAPRVYNAEHPLPG